MDKIVIGFAPTRRSIFSAPAAVEFANHTRQKLKELDVAFVDIDDISDDGLLHDESDRVKIVAKFKSEKVNGLFVPHTNFGTEYEVARLAKELNVPILLWGPRDERPDENGMRLGIVNTDYLQRVKYCVVSAFLLLIFVTADWTIPNLNAESIYSLPSAT